MAISNILKSRFQIFIEEAFQSLLSFIKIIILSKWFLPKPKIKKIHHEVVILGNGPSLSDTIANNPDFLQNKDLFAVNFFWKSPYFTKIKPRYYVILSENYWAKNQIPTNKEGRLATFKELAKAVDWEMHLFVPALAKKQKTWKQELEKNKNIHIHYMNITPVEGLRKISFFFFRLGLGLPRPHNVLIPSIKFAIDFKYSTIYIIGAEHSWLKDIFVADDNTVFLNQRHFYNLNAKPEVMYRSYKNEARTLGEILAKFVYTLNSYFYLNDYAKSNNVNILNATKGSYIDAFDRYLSLK